MKNWLLVIFIILTLGFNIYLYYRVDRLNVMVEVVNRQIGDLENELVVCTIITPDGTTLIRPLRYDKECRVGN